jgi:hypothetical protein
VHAVEPIEPFLTRDMAYVGMLLTATEMALTTVGEMFCSAPAAPAATPGIVDAVDRTNLRGDVSFSSADVPHTQQIDRIVAEHHALTEAAASPVGHASGSGSAHIPSSTDTLLASEPFHVTIGSSM